MKVIFTFGSCLVEKPRVLYHLQHNRFFLNYLILYFAWYFIWGTFMGEDEQAGFYCLLEGSNEIVEYYVCRIFVINDRIRYSEKICEDFIIRFPVNEMIGSERR